MAVIAMVLTLGTGGTFAAATTKSLSTVYTVQNLGDGEATVQVSYYKEYTDGTPGGTWDADGDKEQFTIAQGASKVVAQYFDETLTDGAGSAVVSADQPIAAITNMLARGQTPTSGSYTAFEMGSDSFYMPFAFKNLATSVGTINSQLIIMNVGNVATNVAVEFIPSADTLDSYTKEIVNLPAGESYYYDQSEEAELSDGWYGSAQVSADAGGSIAVVGNQFSGADGLLTYPGFAEGKTDWVVPLYVARLANGFNAVMAIQNVSGAEIAAGEIEVTFTPDAATGQDPFTITNPDPVANNATWTLNPRANDDFPAPADGGSYGAAKISSSGEVVAIVNQLVNEPPNFSPNALSFNAVPGDLTGQKVVVPLAMSRLGNGYSTVVTVANLTGNAGTCDFTYTTDQSLVDSGVDATFSATDVALGANGSIVHNHRLDSGHPLPSGWFGAAEVSCTQPVAGIVNQLQSGASGDPDLSYNAFTTMQ